MAASSFWPKPPVGSPSRTGWLPSSRTSAIPAGSFNPAPPPSVTLDIDDTCDVVHGHQQLSLFNAHHDERCFLPIHLYDTATSRPVAVILRPGKTPSGREVRGHLRRLIRAIRRHWPTTAITIRGDSH